jgi:hypothetical protein
MIPVAKLHYLGSFGNREIFISILEVIFTKSLKMCPKCNSKLEVSSDGETQYCPVCKYWTKIGTARLDSIMIYE